MPLFRFFALNLGFTFEDLTCHVKYTVFVHNIDNFFTSIVFIYFCNTLLNATCLVVFLHVDIFKVPGTAVPDQGHR